LKILCKYFSGVLYYIKQIENTTALAKAQASQPISQYSHINLSLPHKRGKAFPHAPKPAAFPLPPSPGGFAPKPP
jgi:hypothetical protein